jgi:hypothetical protein
MLLFLPLHAIRKWSAALEAAETLLCTQDVGEEEEEKKKGLCL